jgi:hypothetical protein
MLILLPAADALTLTAEAAPIALAMAAAQAIRVA